MIPDAIAAARPATSREVARAERDLQWYWHESEGELSPPSNYAWMLICLEHGIAAGDISRECDTPEEHFLAAKHQRAVRKRLSRLTPTDFYVLRAVLGPGQGPRLACFGRVTPLAPRLLLTWSIWDSLGRPWESVDGWTVRLARAARAGDKVAGLRAAHIRREAERIYAEALRRYLDLEVAHAI